MTSTLPDSPIALSLQDIISLPTEAEPLLELLSYDQIESIEQTLLKVKKRKRLKKETVKHMDSVELKEGIEWISFVCSHNRTVKRYSIRIDIHQVPDLDVMDEKFKNENCVRFFFFLFSFYLIISRFILEPTYKRINIMVTDGHMRQSATFWDGN